MYISFFKRIFDFLVAFILFLLFMPLFLLLALLVKLDSKGPVFFRQQRGGKGGHYFNILFH